MVVVVVADRLSENPFYVIVKKELLSAVRPGRVPWHAPRYPATLLAVLELVTDGSSLVRSSGGGCLGSLGEP